MLLKISVTLLVLWLLGKGMNVAGEYIHLLFALAALVFFFNLVIRHPPPV